MAQKRKKYTSDMLEDLGALDTASRSIKRIDRIDVRCYLCSHVDLQIPLSQVIAKHKITGHGWRCRECFKKAQSEAASLRTGEKNSFYGKKHTKEAAEKRHKAYKEWVQNNPDKVAETAKKREQTKKDRNIINPMQIPEIRQKHKEKVNTPEMKEKFKQNMVKRYNDPKEREKTGLKAREYYYTEAGKEDLIKKANVFRDKNLHDKEWKAKRINGLIQKWEQDPESRFSSKGEKELRDYVSMLGVNVEKLFLDNKEIDVFSSEYKKGIEYNGLYYHCEIKKSSSYHVDKTNHFLQRNIRLIQLWESEWVNRKEQVKSFIRSFYGKNEVKIGMRKCKIKEIDYQVAKELCEQWHIQGAPHTTKYALAAYLNDEVVAVGTFAEHHRGRKEIVLNRLCFKPNTTVNGFLSKISKIASEYFKQDIYSWADRRFSEGNGYINSGWKEISRINHDYAYTDFKKIIPKQSRKKSNVNTPELITESEHALIDGLVKIWDCGKIKFIYKYSPQVPTQSTDKSIIDTKEDANETSN